MHRYANTATCAMLHYTLLGAAPHATNAPSFIYFILSACEGFATGLSHSLQAVPKVKWRMSGRQERGSAAAETKGQVQPSSARPGPAQSGPPLPPPLQSPSSLLRSSLQKPTVEEMSVLESTRKPPCPNKELPVLTQLFLWAM